MKATKFCTFKPTVSGHSSVFLGICVHVSSQLQIRSCLPKQLLGLFAEPQGPKHNWRQKLCFSNWISKELKHKWEMEKNHILQEEPVWRHKRKITLNACSWTESHILNTLRNHSLKQGSSSRTFFSPCYIKHGNSLPGERTHRRIDKSREHEVNKKRHGWMNERGKDSKEEEGTPLFCFAIYWDKLVSIYEWMVITATLNPSLGSSKRGKAKL